MIIVGITGNLGSGKSTLLELLRKKGALVFSSDRQVHKYYSNKKSVIYQKIVLSFPEAIRNNQISRSKLGEIVFRDASQRRKLEKIVHPVVIEDLKGWIRSVKNKKGIAVIEVPLLFEKKLSKYFDEVVLVYVKRGVLIKRIAKNLLLSRREVVKRLSLYLPIRHKIKQADFVVNNSESLGGLKKQMELLWENLKKKNRR